MRSSCKKLKRREKWKRRQLVWLKKLPKPQKRKLGDRKRKQSAWKKKRNARLRRKLQVEVVAVAQIRAVELQPEIKQAAETAPTKALEPATVAAPVAVVPMVRLEAVQVVDRTVALAVVLAE